MKLPDIPPLKKRIDAMPDEKIAIALMENEGLAYITARALGMDGSTISARIKESPFLQAVVEQARELRIDEAERSLSHLVKKPKDLGAICFTLKTVGRKRGYVETVTHEIDAESIAASNAIKEQLAKARLALSEKLEKI